MKAPGIQFRLILLPVGLLLAACASASSSTLTNQGLPQNVEITFTVLVPEGTPAEEIITLDLLDEVTGLDLNAERYPMQTQNVGSYSVKLSVPVGSLLKYRYSRQAAAPVVEASAVGEAVRYRLYLVDGPGHIAFDQVAAWSDQSPALESGQISGVVTDANSGAPLVGYLVTSGGVQRRSDDTGSFVIDGLIEGLHNLVIYAPDGRHRTFQQGALVAVDSNTPADIRMSPNEMLSVTFLLTPPADHVAGIPVRIYGNLSQMGAGRDSAGEFPLLQDLGDGRYGLILELPTGADIRYKYTLGNGFWNAEHHADASFVRRQIIIPPGTTTLEIKDQVLTWAAGPTAAISFDVRGPGTPGNQAFIQFRLLDWMPPIPLWPLEEGHWEYRLYSPTNFATPIQYRYCADALCQTGIEQNVDARLVAGNLNETQLIEDQVEAWAQ